MKTAFAQRVALELFRGFWFPELQHVTHYFYFSAFMKVRAMFLCAELLAAMDILPPSDGLSSFYYG